MQPIWGRALHPAPCTKTFAYRVIKRSIDVLCSLCALILLSWLLGAIALVIKLSSAGPILYCWKVIGRNGRSFVGYKFRTMVPDADELKQELSPRNEMSGPVFKMKYDPRVTLVGRVLRKFSLDELPQLWSVLKGDMSLVGPRPVGPGEWEAFEDWQRRKLTVVPGGVSLWHVRGKPRDFDEWLRLDLEYIDRWSLLLDFKILLGGIWYMLSGTNY